MRTDPPATLCNWNITRGDGEYATSDLKNACLADRLSDHRCCANHCRLLLHAVAYWLLGAMPLVVRRMHRPPANERPPAAPTPGRRARLLVA